jgi:Flp pilus assembly pilin Flp
MAGRGLTFLTRRLVLLRSFVRDEQGQAATEYILIIGLIVIPLAIAFNSIQDVLKDMLKDLARLFSGPGV